MSPRPATDKRKAQPPASSTALPTWLLAASADVAADHRLREVCLPGEPEWLQDTNHELEIRLLELSRKDGRLVAVLQPLQTGAVIGADHGIEMFVQRGSVLLGDERLGPGTYLRLPRDPGEIRAITLLEESLVTVAIGQIESTDTEVRRMDTNDDAAWFEGPVGGVEVLPLHGHGTSTVMLVRWHTTAAFHPNLDPIGEELYVLSGALHDSSGTYPAGSWIRNPVPAWQSWAGTPGTLVWYKSGHFPDGVTITQNEPG